MGLACRDGGRECDGCRACVSEEETERCGRCGKSLDGQDAYSDLFYDVLCLRCLMKLHKN